MRPGCPISCSKKNWAQKGSNRWNLLDQKEFQHSHRAWLSHYIGWRCKKYHNEPLCSLQAPFSSSPLLCLCSYKKNPSQKSELVVPVLYGAWVQQVLAAAKARPDCPSWAAILPPHQPESPRCSSLHPGGETESPPGRNGHVMKGESCKGGGRAFYTQEGGAWSCLVRF